MSYARTVCPHCGVEYGNPHIGRHSANCAKMPPAEEMADMLDAEPLLTVFELSKRYGVNLRAVEVKLRPTRWGDKDRLNARGAEKRAVASQTAREEYKMRRAEMLATGATFCAFCGIREDDRIVCGYCSERLTRFVMDQTLPREWARTLQLLINSETLPTKLEGTAKWLIKNLA